jgi:hypothetical protein
VTNTALFTVLLPHPSWLACSAFSLRYATTSAHERNGSCPKWIHFCPGTFPNTSAPLFGRSSTR